ncbi:hypothetical protein [Zunongwangia sp. HRR-M8]|uniref:hypothetical protein n=1 Tax=Zunongwangia sp. HRR-M8 TaxID=3015170 RepID=UPI0022DE0970|nr:hypothetical protein [Zunongwangia sp. HRR-M8]WBL21722.1 hypothetical protein PBT89_13455 [Zunongwangia sp. HRR-M8]
MKKIAVVLFLFISLVAKSQSWQEGTIVLKNEKQLEGLVMLPVISKDYLTVNLNNKVKFKASKKSKKKKFTEDDIKRIEIIKEGSKSTYVYLPVSEKKSEVFEIVIAGGKVNLYARGVSMTTSNGTGTGVASGFSVGNYDEFYVKRPQEEIASPLVTIRISKSFKNRAADYFSDCPSLVRKLNDKDLKEKDIQKVIEFYNTCN